MVVKIPELPGKKRYQGLYCISPLNPNEASKPDFRFKIGMSTNLLKRLQSYHICYPYGFYIYGLLLTKNKTQRQVLDIEKQFFRKIIKEDEKYYLPTKEISGAKEYFKLPINRLKALLKEIGEETGSEVITEFKAEGFVENDDVETKGISDSEIKAMIKEIDKKSVEYEEKEAKRIKDFDNAKKRYNLRDRVQTLRQKYDVQKNAQIDFDLKGRKKQT